MKRILIIGMAALGLAACSGGVNVAKSPAGACLLRHDYVLVGEDGTFKGPAGQFVNLREIHGTVQPVDQQDLDDYVAAGCS